METKLINLQSKEGNYRRDRELENKFAKFIKAILGNLFIVKDIRLDQEEGTDFLIFRVNPFRVAVRLRRYDAYLKYRDEFTIRWKRPGGTKTEINKIQEGLVDYFFYGFLNQEEDKIINYFVGDLKIFRASGVEPIAIRPNSPPDSDLAAFHLNQFPPEFVLKKFDISSY